MVTTAVDQAIDERRGAILEDLLLAAGELPGNLCAIDVFHRDHEHGLEGRIGSGRAEYRADQNQHAHGCDKSNDRTDHRSLPWWRPNSCSRASSPAPETAWTNQATRDG
jgi:hypothetical protein